MMLGNYPFLEKFRTVTMVGLIPVLSMPISAQENPIAPPAPSEPTTPSSNTEETLPNHKENSEKAPLTDSNITEKTPPEAAEEPAVTPVIEDSYEFALVRGNVLSTITPDRSPDEATSILVPAIDTQKEGIEGYEHLIASIPIRKSNPQKIMFVRSTETGPYDVLIVDRDLDHSFSDETPLITDKTIIANDETLTESREGLNMVEFKTALMTDHVVEENLPALGDYPAILRLEWADLNSPPEHVTWFNYYFYRRDLPVGDQIYQVLLQDVNNDGNIDTADRWMLKNETISYGDNSSRSITDYNWINGQAWKIEIKSPIGNRAVLKKFNPKMSYEQDLSIRDPWYTDKNALRAEKKDRLKILTNYDDAVKLATSENKNLIVKFENTWSEPCSAINVFVLPQQQVVDASAQYVWATINADEQPELVTQFQITQFPTFIIFNPEGRELKRFSTATGSLLVKYLNDALIQELPATEVEEANETPPSSNTSEETIEVQNTDPPLEAEIPK